MFDKLMPKGNMQRSTALLYVSPTVKRILDLKIARTRIPIDRHWVSIASLGTELFCI